jgi:hypothetical protein
MEASQHSLLAACFLLRSAIHPTSDTSYQVSECDYGTGFEWMTRFIDHLQIVATSNDGAIASLHTLQITGAHAKSSQSAFTSRFLVTDPNNGYS